MTASCPRLRRADWSGQQPGARFGDRGSDPLIPRFLKLVRDPSDVSLHTTASKAWSMRRLSSRMPEEQAPPQIAIQVRITA
jgi:hypothetical protein